MENQNVKTDLQSLNTPESNENKTVPNKSKRAITIIVVVLLITLIVCGIFYAKWSEEKRIQELYEQSEAYAKIQKWKARAEESEKISKEIEDNIQSRYDEYYRLFGYPED